MFLVRYVCQYCISPLSSFFFTFISMQNICFNSTYSVPIFQVWFCILVTTPIITINIIQRDQPWHVQIVTQTDSHNQSPTENVLGFSFVRVIIHAGKLFLNIVRCRFSNLYCAEFVTLLLLFVFFTRLIIIVLFKIYATFGISILLLSQLPSQLT